jgi:hypothetical protein
LTRPVRLGIIAKPLRTTANTNSVSFGLAEKIVFRKTSQRRARKQPPLSSLVAERKAFRPAMQTPVFMCPQRPVKLPGFLSFLRNLDTAKAI